MWNGELDTTQESQVIFVTTENFFDEIKSFILKHSKYELPEILKVSVLGGHEEYLTWVKESTSK